MGLIEKKGKAILIPEVSDRPVIPYKHAEIVHPSLLSSEGMQPPNWNIKDPFKVIIPTIITSQIIGNE